MINVCKIQLRILKRNVFAQLIFWSALFFSGLFGLLIRSFSSYSGSLNFLSLMKGEAGGFNFSASLTLSVSRILLFLIVILACTSIPGEVQSGILKSLLVKRLKRDEIVLGKGLALSIFSFVILSLVFILGFISGIILYGFGGIAEKGYVIHSSGSLLLNAWLSLFLIIFPIVAIISLSLLISVLFSNPLLSVIAGLGFHFLSSIFIELELFSDIFLTRYLLFPWAQYQRMAQGLYSAGAAEFFQMILVTLIYMVGSLSLALIIFRKKELS